MAATAMFDPLDPTVKLPSYKVSKQPKGPKQPHLEITRKNAKKNYIIYGGTPMHIDEKVKYDMNLRVVFDGGEGGFVGFAIGENDSRRVKFDFVEKYESKAYRDKLKVMKHHVLKDNMLLFAYRDCSLHGCKELIRGLVKGPLDGLEEDVLLFLVDDVALVRFPRDQLYYAQFNIYLQAFMGTLAELERVDIFQFHGEYTKTIMKFVSNYINDPVRVKFRLDQGKGYYKAEVELIGDISFNKLVLDEFISKSVIQIPNENERRSFKGFVTHADKDGTIYVQTKDSAVTAQALTDWMVSEGHNITVALESPEEGEKLPLKDPIDMKAMYVAPFGEGEDRSLFRARIIKKTDDKKFFVRFVDYGNTAVVAGHDIYFARQIHPALNMLPDLCTPFHLKFVKEIVKINKFSAMFDQEFDVDIRVEKVGTLRSVLLRLDGRIINKEMCQNGWAIVRSNDTKSELSFPVPVRKN